MKDSESESFFAEVSEELRRDKLYSIWRRWGRFVIAAIAAAVIGALLLDWYRDNQSQEARNNSERLSEILQIDDPEKAAIELGRFAAEVTGGYQLLAQMHQADAYVRSGQKEQALSIYAALSGNSAILPIYRDLATIKSLMIQAEDGDAERLIRQLESVAKPNSPFRYMARELMAEIYLREGEVDKAVTILDNIVNSRDADIRTRSRAQKLREIAAPNVSGKAEQ